MPSIPLFQEYFCAMFRSKSHFTIQLSKPRRAYGFAYMMSRFLRNFCPTNQFFGSASTRIVNCNDPRPSLRGQAQLPVHRSQFSRQMAVCLGKFTPCARDLRLASLWFTSFSLQEIPPKKSQVEIRIFMTVHHLLIRDLCMRHKWYTMLWYRWWFFSFSWGDGSGKWMKMCPSIAATTSSTATACTVAAKLTTSGKISSSWRLHAPSR